MSKLVVNTMFIYAFMRKLMKSIEPPAEWASKMLINLIPPELTSQTSKNLQKKPRFKSHY